jgi:nucleoside phosphorylase
MGDKLDVVILTVLQEEYDAVCSKLSDLRPWPGDEDSTDLYAWQIGTIPCHEKRSSYSLAVGKIGRAGNNQSTAATLEAIKLWQPRYIFLVGVAGGLSRMTKGDIVIADVIHGYEYGKIENGFNSRSDWTFKTDIGLRNGAENHAKNNSWRDLIYLKPPETCSTKIEIGMVVSGEKVVDNPDYAFFKQVLSAYPKAKAVEMEGAGVGHAIELALAQRKIIGFLMIRGISDVPRPEGEEVETRGTKER